MWFLSLFAAIFWISFPSLIALVEGGLEWHDRDDHATGVDQMPLLVSLQKRDEVGDVLSFELQLVGGEHEGMFHLADLLDAFQRNELGSAFMRHCPAFRGPL